MIVLRKVGCASKNFNENVEKIMKIPCECEL